jgi:hypothetical protein
VSKGEAIGMGRCAQDDHDEHVSATYHRFMVVERPMCAVSQHLHIRARATTEPPGRGTREAAPGADVGVMDDLRPSLTWRIDRRPGWRQNDLRLPTAYDTR